ncbi:MAG TPA: type II CAAX endopeptidase family protein [Planctomycetaceae bacterium]|nr:type II CAAX endopeptidase family protein [Planctomycetaceae bacterium]
MFDLTNRYEFLSVAILFEGSLIGVAGLLGRWFDVDPLGKLSPSLSSVAWGTAATVPMLLLFLICYRWPVGPFRRIKQLLVETLGPSLAACRWYDLLLLAAVAGVGEELLFRGVLQPRLGLAGSNILFGVAHSVSPVYALLAGGIGVYLGWLFKATGNLLAPIVTHGLYDFLAFLVVARDFRRTRLSTGPDGANPSLGPAD